MRNLTSTLKESRIIKRIFVCGSVILLLAGLTPLEFRHPWLALLVTALVFVLSFPVAKDLAETISIGWVGKIVANIPNTALFLTIVLLITTFPFSIMSAWNSLGGYKTVWIKYRNKNDLKTHIASQMKDVGSFGYARRTVTIVPLSPLFAWITDTSDSVDSKEWKKVDEHYNPFDWKGP